LTVTSYFPEHSQKDFPAGEVVGSRAVSGWAAAWEQADRAAHARERRPPLQRARPAPGRLT
jgi:hypothetical protein